ncbi:MAG: hypothetical protein J0L66_09345 [Cytophagales bacterium]|nr:hypothetical protein [Cytophagales bacterium]
MMWALHVPILFGLLYAYNRVTNGNHQLLFWASWGFRVVMGVALGVVYLVYYQESDTWYFFENAKSLSQAATDNLSGYFQFLFKISDAPFWQPVIFPQERSLFLIKIVSVLALLTGNNYWICTLYFGLFSFLAAWHLFIVVTRYLKDSQLAAALALLWLPTAVFWSSGLVKETLALAGIFWITSVAIRVANRTKVSWYQWGLSLVAVWVAWNLKYYWTALYLAVLFSTGLLLLLQSKWPRLHAYKEAWWLFIFGSVAVVASLLHPNFHLNRILPVIVDNHDAFVRISKPENLIHFYNLQPGWSSILFNAPWALVSGLFRPVVGELSGATAVAASIENLLLAVLFIAGIFKAPAKQHRLWWMVTAMYVVALCVFLALSTPNFGTLSRYRVGFLPFFVFIIAYRNPLLKFLQSRFMFRK